MNQEKNSVLAEKIGWVSRNYTYVDHTDREWVLEKWSNNDFFTYQKEPPNFFNSAPESYKLKQQLILWLRDKASLEVKRRFFINLEILFSEFKAIELGDKLIFEDMWLDENDVIVLMAAEPEQVAEALYTAIVDSTF